MRKLQRVSNKPDSRRFAGQAMIEMAVIGSIALLGMAMLVQMGLRMNYQQSIEQQTFRKALGFAHREPRGSESAATTYYEIRNRQLPDITQGFLIRPRVQTQASNTVVWGTDLTLLDSGRNSQARIIVHLDNPATPGEGVEPLPYRAEDLRKTEKGTGNDCPAYYYTCVRNDDCENVTKDARAQKACFKNCRDQEEARCDEMPLIGNITNTLDSQGEVRQTQTSSSAWTQTTHTSKVTMNTKSNSVLQSTLTRRPAYNW